MDATISKLDLRSFNTEDFFEVNECCVNDTGVLVKLKSKNRIVNVRDVTRYQIVIMAHINVWSRIFLFSERIHPLL